MFSLLTLMKCQSKDCWPCWSFTGTRSANGDQEAGGLKLPCGVIIVNKPCFVYIQSFPQNVLCVSLRQKAFVFNGFLTCVGYLGYSSSSPAVTCWYCNVTTTNCPHPVQKYVPCGFGVRVCPRDHTCRACGTS